MTATLLLQIAAKATLILLAGWALTRLMVRMSAAARHLVWVLALIAALAVPFVHMMAPEWTLAVLPSSPVAASSEATAVLVVGSDHALMPTVADRHADAPATTVAPAVLPQIPDTPLSWGQVLVRIWLVGVAVMLIRLVIGVTWAALTVRRSLDLPHTGWLDSLGDASMALGLTRRVGLKVSERAAVPMATGLWNAVVLLPLSAIDWPEERRRVVLQHELAHVKRRDCLIQALAQCACAVHWFNPAAHLALAGLRAEQERACDDIVIAVGTDARSYADHLFEIARSFRAASFPTWVAMSMARPSQLEGRMLAILDEARVRCAPSAGVRTALVMVTVALALPFGAMRLAAQSSGAVDVITSGGAAAIPASPAPQAIPPANDADVLLGPLSASTVELVQGDLADVDLIASPPAQGFGDAFAAGGFDEPGVASSLRIWKDASGARGLLAQAGLAAQAGTPVSDETRKRVADALITALNDDNPQVRQEALSSLASMRDERAIPGLVRALGDPVTEVRLRALGALVQFESAAAADGVLSALKDRSPEVREQAARHLASLVGRGRLSDPKYVNALSTLLKDDNPEVREQGARALGRLGSADAVPALSGLLKDSSKDVREQAALALGNIADPRAIDALTAALKDTEPSVREQAARALGQIARGQRRGIRPGVPVPPAPPLPPRAFVDRDQIREMTERAREMAEDARRDVESAMRDLNFKFDLSPVPEPAPVPAPPTLRR